MSTLVLLNADGSLSRKLQFVAPPADYVIPEGMTLSWKIELHVASIDPLASCGAKEPIESYFYLGQAVGQVCRKNFQPFGTRTDRSLPETYGSRDLTITVQGQSVQDVMQLRERILAKIHSSEPWQITNDLNPKPKTGFWVEVRKLLKMDN